MASVAATSTLAAALAGQRRARLPPRRPAVVRCSLDSNVSDMGVNGEERDPAEGTAYVIVNPQCYFWPVGFRSGMSKTGLVIS